jgi:hypothetical protein
VPSGAIVTSMGLMYLVFGQLDLRAFVDRGRHDHEDDQ